MPQSARKIRVLIVEDEISFQQVLANVIRGIGRYEVIACDTGEAGVEALKAGTIDLAVLDHKLPGISGLNVLQWIHEEKMEIPVIMLTGVGSESLAVEAMKLGAYDYVQKDEFDQYHFSILLNGVFERYLFKKERQRNETAAKEKEKDLLTLQLLRNAVTSMTHIVNSTLSLISSNIEERRAELGTMLNEEGRARLDKAFTDMKREYEIISRVSKSLLELSIVMFERFEGRGIPTQTEITLQNTLQELQKMYEAYARDDNHGPR